MGSGINKEGEQPNPYRVLFHRMEAESDDNTSRVVITCTKDGLGDDGKKCSEWLLEPEPVGEGNDYVGRYSAKVVRQNYGNKGRGQLIVTTVGYFDMPFSMTFTAPAVP